MKKLIVIIIGAVLVLAAYLFGTINAKTVISIPDAKWTEESDAANAWREYTASLESAGARAFAASTSEREKLESLLYLSQLSAASLEMKLAKGSASEPKFTDWMRDYRKFLGDSPDAIYHTAQLSPEFSYEITGNRRDAEYLGFVLYGRLINGWNRAASSLSSDKLKFDSGGNFRIVLSQKKPENYDGDWLKLENEIHMVMVRQYFHDREGKAAAQFSIRTLNPQKPQPLTDTVVADGLRDAAGFFNDTLDGAIALSNMFEGGPNDINPPKSYSNDFGGVFYPTTDNEYHGAWFDLAEDEALVIEGAVPDARYWGISLQNRWMQSLDYEHYQVELNDQDITTKDGRYRVVIAHKKPPSGNWIDTTGHQFGFLSIRYQQSKDSEQPSLEFVKFDDL